MKQTPAPSNPSSVGDNRGPRGDIVINPLDILIIHPHTAVADREPDAGILQRAGAGPVEPGMEGIAAATLIS